MMLGHSPLSTLSSPQYSDLPTDRSTCSIEAKTARLNAAKEERPPEDESSVDHKESDRQVMAVVGLLSCTGAVVGA